MLEAIPKSCFSWNFKVSNDNVIADLDMSCWREKGELRIDGYSYVVHQRAILSSSIIFELNNSELAKATRAGFFWQNFLLELNEKKQLETKSILRPKIVLKNDWGKIGSLVPHGLFSRLSLATIVLLFASDMLALTLAVIYESFVARIIAYFITFLLLSMAFGSYRFARRDKVLLSVLINVAVWYFLALCMTLVGGRLYSPILVCSIMPVMMAMPFVVPNIA